MNYSPKLKKFLIQLPEKLYVSAKIFLAKEYIVIVNDPEGHTAFADMDLAQARALMNRLQSNLDEQQCNVDAAKQIVNTEK